MAARKVDWSILRGTVIGFALCVVISAAMVAASLWFKDRMGREYQTHHSQFRAASQQYLAVDEEERIIEEFYPEFVRLYRGGLLGRERRLSWLETLRSAGDAIRVPELSYKLEAQRDAEVAPTLPLGGYGIFASSMNLSLGLLHEGDLLQLLNALDREAQGQYTVRECVLSSAGEPTLDAGQANVRAECALDWLTIDLDAEQGLVL